MGSGQGRIAVKRLAKVEVDPKSSHQHEFNADRLREGLGYGYDKIQGPATILYYTEDDEPPTVDECSFTLYDSRERHETRTEWRLYYTSRLLSELAEEGDLLVMFRPPDDDGLKVVIAARGTEVEKQLQRLIVHDDHAALQKFFFPDVEEPSAKAGAELVQTLVTPTPKTSAGYVLTTNPVYIQAIKDGELPTTKQMAEAAQEMVLKAYGEKLDADELLDRALEAETALYYAISNEISTKRLGELLAKGTPKVTDVLAFAMEISQSSKSRRGRSLENHFDALLRREKIPFSHPCRTEGKETADFMIPGCDEYQDKKFPSDRLRMVACKSTARERWAQVLKEADRVEEKYLLTVDEDLTDDQIKNMAARGLRVFLPRRVLEEFYESSSARDLLGDIDDLLTELHEVL